MVSAFFEQVKTCPVCEKKFTVTRVRSSACYVMKRESDFNTIYRDVNPVHYTVWVCPHCQYAAPDKNFSDELRPAELERLKKGLALLRTNEPDFSGERTPAVALRSFELAIRTAQIRQAGPGFKASLYLRAAWICRELGKEEQEKEMLKEALNHYKESFEKEVNLASRLSDVRLMYIIGELNRRLGYLDEAIQWFSRAVMNKDIKHEPELERMLRDQWDLAREERKKVDSVPLKKQSKDSQFGDNQAEKTEEPSQPLTSATPKPRHRNKVKMFASIYTDQVEWLKEMSNFCYNKTQVLLGKEAVLRAVLDAIIEANIQIEGSDTEEGLKEQILSVIKK
ncbi:hypothetical protein Tfer_1118 [Thermincola ferriacetica]|uniref:DUF2225 domain-containing protein n=1 Tax=Thermincola ferriacetica TaxID=281456 RepID=A0A0L6W3X7_9FIRM|nr:DUF2225 domain-containing protein [Thermincola ferriacetica]KNZ70240.1 hypothetical protein Tfer_1118 [Thermincola ferriacetica]